MFDNDFGHIKVSEIFVTTTIG